ncbi:MAG: oligosaccharide flippase family protein [Chlorobi bacterium]|nr:oligosaccharide flippase family protein [Chlorobiota bacterium]
MQLRNHVSLLIWTVGDKLLFLGYGVITWIQIRALPPEEYALAAQLLTLQAWIAIVAEGSFLQGIIQYGHDHRHREHANFLAAILHTAFTLGVALIIAGFGLPLAALFNEARFHDVALLLPLYCALGIPRSYALKLLQRELRVRHVFTTNAAWLGTSALLTIIFLARGTLRTFEDMALIACSGMAAGSIVALALGRDLLRWSPHGTLSYRAVLRFTMPQTIMMALATSIRQLDVFLVQLFFSTRAAGVYTAAKMLYRVFETGADATVWLMYPAAVRLLAQERRDSLRQLIAKAFVVQLIIAATAVCALEFGGTALIVRFFGNRYSETAVIFNIMAIGALFLPLAMLQSVILALHRVDRLLLIISTSVFAACAVYVTVGILDIFWLMGSGVVVFAAVSAVLMGWTLSQEGLFHIRDIPPAFNDIRTRLGVSLKQWKQHLVTRSDL